MKVLLINQHIYDGIGGSEIQCDLIAWKLSEKGHKVLYGIVNPQKVQYNCEYATTFIKKPFLISYFNLVRQFKPDVIYWRYHKYKLLTAVIISRILKTPFVYVLSSMYDIKVWVWQKPKRSSQTSFPWCNKLSKLLRYIFSSYRSLKNLWNYCGVCFVDAFISMNSEFLGKLPIPRQIHINNSMKKEYIPFEWKKPYIFWVANLKRSKNPEKYIELAGYLEKTNVDCLMVGDIQDEHYQFVIKEPETLPKNLYFLGSKKPEEVNGILRASLFLVHTCSPNEGFPNNFIQAWLQGKPTISLYFDPESIIRKYNLGYVSGSMDQLFVDAERLIKDHSLRSKMGRRAKEHANKRFDINSNITLLENFLSTVITGKKTKKKTTVAIK